MDNKRLNMNLALPSIDNLLAQQRAAYLKSGWDTGNEIRQVVSPYRICPLGAHVDHQGGRVLGRTINAYSVLTFSTSSTDDVRMISGEFDGEEVFFLGQTAQKPHTAWGKYLRGAASVLMKKYSLACGIHGQVFGSLPGGGLSSSASVGLAYLYALAFSNQIRLSPWEAIELDRQLENDYLGLANGILDQSMISLGRKGSMLYLNARTQEHDWVLDSIDSARHKFLVVYSGYSRSLVSTGFNDRVGECHKAAQLMGEMSGIVGAQVLSDIPVDIFMKYKEKLPEELSKRASHYYSEVERVDKGRLAWQEGNLVDFGRMMNESCYSSITQYESGCEPIIQLHEIVSGASGVLGSRFGGGGYGGCVIGLVESDKLEKAAGEIREAYLRIYPEMEDAFIIFKTENEDGVRVV